MNRAKMVIVAGCLVALASAGAWAGEAGLWAMVARMDDHQEATEEEATSYGIGVTWEPRGAPIGMTMQVIQADDRDADTLETALGVYRSWDFMLDPYVAGGLEALRLDAAGDHDQVFGAWAELGVGMNAGALNLGLYVRHAQSIDALEIAESEVDVRATSFGLRAGLRF